MTGHGGLVRRFPGVCEHRDSMWSWRQTVTSQNARSGRFWTPSGTTGSWSWTKLKRTTNARVLPSGASFNYAQKDTSYLMTLTVVFAGVLGVDI